MLPYFCIIINNIKVMSATDLYTLFYQWINRFDQTSEETDYPVLYSDNQEDNNLNLRKDSRFTVNY